MPSKPSQICCQPPPTSHHLLRPSRLQARCRHQAVLLCRLPRLPTAWGTKSFPARRSEITSPRDLKVQRRQLQNQMNTKAWQPLHESFPGGAGLPSCTRPCQAGRRKRKLQAFSLFLRMLHVSSTQHMDSTEQDIPCACIKCCWLAHKHLRVTPEPARSSPSCSGRAWAESASRKKFFRGVK